MTEKLLLLRELNLGSMMLRILLAMLMGGVIGLDREMKGRPAGFRTYMLVAMGAAATSILSQYLTLMLSTQWAEDFALVGQKTDAVRLGAQVISGIGFLGAGTIIVTKRNEIKGLTTAATLWSTACMGIAVGVGFYECAMIMYILLIIILVFVSVLDKKYLKIPTSTALYLEVRKEAGLGDAIEYIHDVGWHIREVKEFPSGREDVLAVRMDLESDNALRGDVSAIRLLVEQPDVLRLEM